MSTNKEEILKAILSIRRRLSHIQLGLTREIDIFEEQVNKSLRRIDTISYLSKKFSLAELIQTQKAYDELMNPTAISEEENNNFQ
ncbi:hypothetical protein [Cellulosilyticum sp. I15G10I2]|uniref:hypothetical protein n=1 Tax=Cellulosilyticum sp. I15G10I2 TaxID=1892843 RepID=UPI00085BC63D|nr:hypothetical protein [Cellulosilyticum sp. I15G10I2]